MGIRYDDQLNKQILDAVDHYNKALRRLESKGVSKAFLPNKISTKMLKETYTDRRKLLRRVKQLKSLSSKGSVFQNEEGVYLNEGSLKYVKQQLKFAKFAQTQKIKSMKARSNGSYLMHEEIKSAEAVRAAMNVNFKKATTRQFKKMYIDAPLKEQKAKRDKVFYGNFGDMLLADANIAGVDKKTLNAIKQGLSQLTPEEVLTAMDEVPALKRVLENYHIYTKRATELTEFELQSIFDDVDELKKQMPKIVERYKS